MDPVALLKEDHTKVKGMFQQFENAKERPDEMKRIADQAIMELQIHSMIEEELFYPALRRGQETEEILNEAEEEHHVVDLLIDELLKMKATDKQFAAKFTVLAENTKHHIQEEEGEMLPKAQQILGGRYQELGDQMMQRKQALMKEFGGKPRKTTGRRTTAGKTSTSRSRATGSRSPTASTTRASTSRSGTRAASSRAKPASSSRSKTASGSRGKSGASSRSRS